MRKKKYKSIVSMLGDEVRQSLIEKYSDLTSSHFDTAVEWFLEGQMQHILTLEIITCDPSVLEEDNLWGF